MDSRLSAGAQRVLKARLRICEEQHLQEGAAFLKEALDNWDQADYEKWARVDDLSAHPKNREELEQFRRQWGLTGLGEQDIEPRADDRE